MIHRDISLALLEKVLIQFIGVSVVLYTCMIIVVLLSKMLPFMISQVVSVATNNFGTKTTLEKHTFMCM